MTFACSRAVSYVDSKNVVHSIERTRSVSSGEAAGWRPVTEGMGPFGWGRICVGMSALARILLSRPAPLLVSNTKHPETRAREKRATRERSEPHLKHPLHRPLRRSHRHPSHIQVMAPCALQRRLPFFEIRSKPEGREERRVPLDGVVPEGAGVEGYEGALAGGLGVRTTHTCVCARVGEGVCVVS